MDSASDTAPYFMPLIRLVLAVCHVALGHHKMRAYGSLAAFSQSDGTHTMPSACASARRLCQTLLVAPADPHLQSSTCLLVVQRIEQVPPKR